MTELRIRNYFLNALDKPIILKGYLHQESEEAKWKCLKWHKKDWTMLLGSDSYKIQFGKVLDNEPQDCPQWEHTNMRDSMTYEDLLQWDDGKRSLEASCKTNLSREKYWAYLGYYYFKDFKNSEVAEEIISWETLGFPELKAKDSTLWIGTAGSNTPCHIDTYGANIVCQIYGKKRWTLFPKEQSSYLYPSRVPYEESSIYSEVGFPKPNMGKFPKFAHTTPYVATLQAGDVLLVPKQWWHFVENLEFSISINTWVPLATDYQDQLKESLVLYQIGSLCQSVTSTTLLKSLFNPNMMDVLVMDSSELLQLLKEKVLHYKTKREQVLAHKMAVYADNSESIQVFDSSDVASNQTLPCITQANFMKAHSFQEYSLMVGIDNSSAVASSEVNIQEILINTLTDDRVISAMKQALDENLQNKCGVELVIN